VLDGIVCRGPTLSQLRQLFTLLTRAHFGAPQNYTSDMPSLACLKYNPPDPDSNMLIDTQHAYDPAQTGGVAGVMVGIRTAESHKQAMGDLESHEPRTRLPGDPEQGEVSLARKTRLQLTFGCFHQNPDIVLDMAESMTGFLLALHESLSARMHLIEYEIQSIQLDEQKPAPQQLHRATIVLTIAYRHGMLVRFESHLLRDTMLELTRERSGFAKG